MTHTYCMNSHCALAEGCARYEDDAGQHLLNRMVAGFSEEMIHRPDSTTTCPFFLDRHGVADGQAGSH